MDAQPRPLATFPEGAPNGLAEDLSTLAALPAEAQRDLAGAVRSSLGATVGAAAERALADFCGQHALELDAVVVYVRAARALIREAARLDLPVEAVHDDVVALTASRDVARRVAASYETVLLSLRGERVLVTLERFGPVLQDVALRMDHVPLSRHHPGRVYPVAMMSLPYREGGEDKTVTVQVTPALLQKLRRMLDAAMP